ncbi:MAG: PEP-CTERM sorting domain-containing protein [Pirellula sp.]
MIKTTINLIGLIGLLLLTTNHSRGDMLTFNITSGSLVLSGNSNVTGVGNFNYTQQGAGSLTTTYTGSLVVDVNNVLSPTSIIFSNANINANTNGSWSPNDQGNGQTPSSPADYGIRVGEIQANGKLRNIVFNVAAASATVNAGNYSVANQSWSYLTGNIDVFSDALMDGTSSTLTGSASNTNAAQGTYGVAGSTVTLTVPVTVSIAYTLPGTPTVTGFNTYTGTLTGIAAVPEPTSIALVGICGCAGLLIRRRKRRTI